MNREIIKRIKAIGNKGELQFFFGLLAELIQMLSIGPDDEHLALNVRNDYRKRFSVNINGRLVLSIQEDGILGLMLNNQDLDKVRAICAPISELEFGKGGGDASWLEFKIEELELAIEQIKPLWLKSCKEYLPKQERSQYRNKHIEELYEMATNAELLNEYLDAELETGYGDLYTILNDLKVYLKSEDNVLADFAIGKYSEKSKWGWISDHLGVIGDSIAHYEIIRRFNKVYVEIHFEGKTQAFKDQFQQSINELPRDLDWIDWQNSKSIRCRSGIDINDTDIVEKLANQLLYLEESVGNQIREIMNPLKIIVANITWNGSDWKTTSEDESNHAWVKEGNIPNESWNFDFDNSRNTDSHIFGFCQFTKPPSVSGNNNLIIFYSAGKIVGFYGKAQVLKDNVEINERESYNLIGDRDLSLVLPNKINDMKDKGYLEDKSRVGQIGFSYLDKKETALKILEEAKLLNPIESEKIDKLINWVNASTDINNKNNKSSTMANTNSLNSILYGPPGTGKTYNTINKALQIVDPDYYEANKKDRTRLTERFKELLIKNWENTEGRIAFCTFHQSFSYEDFVEGIKPKITNDDEGEVKYHIEDGIFKNICQLSRNLEKKRALKKNRLFTMSPSDFKTASIYKLSLGDSTNGDDKIIYEYCRDNGQIAIGFADGVDFTGLSESEVKNTCNVGNIEPFKSQMINRFINYLKVGNYVLVLSGNNYVKALGKVTGDYRYEANEGIRFNHFRSVDWIFTDEEIPVYEVYTRNFIQDTIYKLDSDAIKPEFFIGNENAIDIIEPKEPAQENLVLIIDEINRGNVSAIFGELITLLEPDKRAGGDEELSVTLPYSKQQFSVPNNVYVVGTMNTADRSIEALDTALRRRFSFIEMPPRPSLIATEELLRNTAGKIGEVDVVKVLETINNRIEKLIDKDHKIGHSYFLNISSPDQLEAAFKDKVIPLLEEYFFGDFGKISLVLGSSFITKNKNDETAFAKSNEYDPSVASDLMERAIYKINDPENWDFMAIYE